MILRSLLLIWALCGVTQCRRASPEDDLRPALLKNYDPASLPQLKTDVRLRYTVLNFDMNEKMHSLDLDLWVGMDWKDPRLAWDKTAYPKTKKIAFAREKIWHPDLALYNNALIKDINSFSDALILAMADGSINWVPTAHVKATCAMDMTYWPYDAHNCTVKFGSWVYDGSSVNFSLKDDIINFQFEDPTNQGDADGNNLVHGEWNLVTSFLRRDGTYYACCPEEYISITLGFLLQRNAPAYAYLIQTPAIVLSLLTIAVFLLPPSSGEKVIVGMLALILDIVFLLASSLLIQHSANHTPLIVLFIHRQLILTTSTIAVSAIILRLVRDPHSNGLPTFLRVPLVTLSTCLCLNGYRHMVATSLVPFSRTIKEHDVELNDGRCINGNIYTPTKSKGSDCDWLLLAAVIDRIGLIVYIVIFIVSMINFSHVL